MSNFPSSSIGLPQDVNYQLPPSLSDSARSYSVNLAPDGITSVASSAPSAFFSSGAVNQIPFNSQIVSFTLPSGMSDSVFLDPQATTLSFTLTYTLSTPNSGGTGNLAQLIGSAASFFDQLVVYSNNVPIETIGQYGLLQNFLLQNTVNIAERYGGICVAMGSDNNSATGVEIGMGQAVNQYRYNFCLPLLSVIGVNSSKYIPVGSINNLQLQMTTATNCPIISYCSAVGTQPVFSQPFTLSEFTLNMKYVDIGDQASMMLKQTLVDGRWLIKSTSYTNSAVQLSNGSFGNQQLLLQIRNTSVKSIYHQFGAATSLTSPNGYYDAIHIGCNSRQLQIGGNYFPNKNLNDSQRPAEGYCYLIQALGGGIAKSLGTVVTREMYNSCAGIGSVPANSDTCLVLVSAANRNAPNGDDNTAISVIKWPSSHYLGYDLEKVNGVLFSGYNTRSTPPFLNLNLSTALNTTVICQAWGLSDIILAVDLNSKSMVSYI